MFAPALTPAPAGWALPRASSSPAARRALFRDALLLSAILHLSAGLLFSHLLRERPEDAVRTLAMRPRVVLVSPGTAEITPLKVSGPVPHRAAGETGIPVPVPEIAAAVVSDLWSAFQPVAGPPVGGEAPDGGAVAGGPSGTLRPPAETAPFPLGAVVDEAPQVIARVTPEYPLFAREAGLEGRVVLHVLVGVDGAVRRIRVVEGSEVFLESARTAVMRWRFRPARVDRRPVPIWVEIPIRFRL
jgi:protein TonB